MDEIICGDATSGRWLLLETNSWLTNLSLRNEDHNFQTYSDLISRIWIRLMAPTWVPLITVLTWQSLPPSALEHG